MKPTVSMIVASHQQDVAIARLSNVFHIIAIALQHGVSLTAIEDAVSKLKPSKK